MDIKPNIPPLVLIRVPRQKCYELHNLTINGIRAVVIGEPKAGMNYARLVKIQAQGYRGQYGPALMIIQAIDEFTNREPLIISYRNIGNLEATLQIMGYKLEDMSSVQL